MMMVETWDLCKKENQTVVVSQLLPSLKQILWLGQMGVSTSVVMWSLIGHITWSLHVSGVGRVTWWRQCHFIRLLLLFAERGLKMNAEQTCFLLGTTSPHPGFFVEAMLVSPLPCCVFLFWLPFQFLQSSDNVFVSRFEVIGFGQRLLSSVKLCQLNQRLK